MKINQMETANIIEYAHLEKTSKTKINCPSPKILIALQRFELSDRKRSKVIDHLADCSTCVQEIKFINEILTEEKIFDKEAAQIVTRRNPAARKKFPFVKSPFPKLSWSSMSVIAVLTTIILFSSIFFLIKTNKTAIERDSILHINHISPDNTSLSLSELIFQWENIPESDYYTVYVYDDSADLVWKIERIVENKVIPSAELKDLLKQETTYLWMVTSFLKNGKQVESHLAKFTLK